MSIRLLILPQTLLLGLAVALFVWPHAVQAEINPPPVDSGLFAEPITPTQTLSNTIALLASPTFVPPPTYVKGIYMTYHAVGHDGLRTHALDLIDKTELNTLVIDIKGDLGVITYKSDVITATAIGANDAPTISDWRAFTRELKERDIYTIARIVVFKDNYLARAHPEWAVKDAAGRLWFDGEDLPWLEPFHEQVWDYNIALAVEAAERGFDEVQFDYIRFPTDGYIGNIVYSQPADTPAARTKAINGLLAKAKVALAPYPTKLAADVFGYTTWFEGDFQIGQDLSRMAAYLDVISPMLYPSTYSYGLPGMPEYDVAVAFPYQVVYQSMIRGLSRVKATNPDIIVRPWIQDFPDYGFDRRIYTPQEIRAQIFAAYDTGGGGWMLWDPRVKYTAEALASTDVSYPPNEMGDIMVLRYENFGAENLLGVRSTADFRQDLEQLWAAGFYPINLRDLAMGRPQLRRDVQQLSQDGWTSLQVDDLMRGRLNHVPAGKRPIVLTFDGSNISQYRLLPDGRLDPESAVGVLYQFHLEHPADWPLRATFFVQPDADDLDSQFFGQTEFAAQKLQNLVDWGMEIGLYHNFTAAELSAKSPREIRRQLKKRQAKIGSLLGNDTVDSLALALGSYALSESQRWPNLRDTLGQDFALITTRSDGSTPSPQAVNFDAHDILRLPVKPATIAAWLEFYRRHPEAYYVAAGVVPEVRPVD